MTNISLTHEDVINQFMDGYLRVLEGAGMDVSETSTNYLLGRAIAKGIAQVQDPRVLHIDAKFVLKQS